MARIFSVLAILALLLLAANFFVGLWVGDFNAAARRMSAAAQKLQTSPDSDAARREFADADTEFRAPRQRMTLHMLLGSAASLVAILVNSITITYFIGTSRWCKEVCETYRLPAEMAERSTRLKRSTFPWALAGILTIIAIVALGAAADPSGANFEQAPAWVMPHYLAAIIGILIVGGSFWVQISRIAENYAVIEQILGEVERKRAEVEGPKTTI